MVMNNHPVCGVAASTPPIQEAMLLPAVLDHLRACPDDRAVFGGIPGTFEIESIPVLAY